MIIPRVDDNKTVLIYGFYIRFGVRFAQLIYEVELTSHAIHNFYLRMGVVVHNEIGEESLRIPVFQSERLCHRFRKSFKFVV